ncbi:MAG: TfoX/Sxy family protein [Chthonomonas sp.]|nr:TfoX/Sxy family protein [Chthonomonas sp.]
MPYNTDLADRLRQVLQHLNLKAGEVLGETKMFGGLCFTLNGKMLVGIDKDRLVVRLGDEDFARESQAGRALPMDLTGRPLRNFAFLCEGSFETEADVLNWAEMSARFVREHMLNKSAKQGRKRR